MRSPRVVASLTAVLCASAGYAQQPSAARPCLAQGGPPIEYLQKLVRQYHPQALAPATQQNFVLVGFMLDSTCRVLHHAVGRRASDHVTVDSALAGLFLGVATTPFIVSGLADAIASQVPGHPWIAWVVLKRT